MKRFFRYLILSVIVHALLLMFIGSSKEYWMPEQPSSVSKKMKVSLKPKEKTVKKEDDKENGQIVEPSKTFNRRKTQRNLIILHAP